MDHKRLSEKDKMRKDQHNFVQLKAAAKSCEGLSRLRREKT